MITIEFKELTKDDKALFDAYRLDRYYENSHVSFTNLFMWRQAYEIMWAENNGILYAKARWDGGEFAVQPYCLAGTPCVEAIANLDEYFAERRLPFRMYGIEAGMAEACKAYFGDSALIEADRNNFDYVYLSDDLKNLAGRKYHGKKNHLNSFKKNYQDAVYMPITEEIVTQCKLNINGWYKQHGSFDDPILTTERKAIIEVLNNFADLDLVGGALLLDSRVIAFTFGEMLNADTAVIHVEKADPEIRGAYTAINQMFVEHVWADRATYINREEDMGLDGLRQAKLSYKPAKLIEKFNVVKKI